MEISEAYRPVRAIAHGFAALKRAPLSLFVGGLVMGMVWLCSGGGGGGGGGDLEEATKDAPPEVTIALAMMMLVFLAVGLVVGLIAFFVKCWLLPGWIRLQRHVLEHGTDEVPLLFSGGDAVWKMLLWRLLQGFIRVGTTLMAVAPGLAIMVYGTLGGEPRWDIVAAGGALAMLLGVPVIVYIDLGLRLGDHAVALEGLGPMGALERSWELADGNRVRLWLFFFVTDFFAVFGIFLCIIGVLPTSIIAQVGATEAFVLATVPGAEDWVIPREEGL